MKKLIKIILSLSILLSCFGCSSSDPNRSIEDVIKEGAKLSTLEVVFNVVAGDEDSFVILDKKYWVEYKEHVYLGIDLEKVSSSVVGDIVTVELPPVSIINNAPGELLDENIIEINFFDLYKFSESQKNDIKKQAEQNALDKALASTELTALAEERSKAFIQGLVEIYNDQNGKQYKVEFK